MKHRDEQWLREKYIKEGLSCTEISELCEVSRSAVHRSLKKFEIETRSEGTSDFGSQRYHNLEWLHKKFHEEGLSYAEIADLCDVTKQTIYNSAKKVGLDTDGDTRYEDGNWFREQYLEQDRTLDDIAEECGVSRPTIIKWKKKHSIPTQYPTGEKHPQTKPPEKCVTRKRGEDWHHQRQEALERANYACENSDCDEDAESLGKNPDVHHIVPHRFHEEHEDINSLDNLVVLCRSCHSEVEPPQWLKSHNEVGDDESVVDFSISAR